MIDPLRAMARTDTDAVRADITTDIATGITTGITTDTTRKAA